MSDSSKYHWDIWLTISRYCCCSLSQEYSALSFCLAFAVSVWRRLSEVTSNSREHINSCKRKRLRITHIKMISRSWRQCISYSSWCRFYEQTLPFCIRNDKCVTCLEYKIFQNVSKMWQFLRKPMKAGISLISTICNHFCTCDINCGSSLIYLMSYSVKFWTSTGCYSWMVV